VKQDRPAVPMVDFCITSGDGSIISLPWVYADPLPQRRTNRLTHREASPKVAQEETAYKGAKPERATILSGGEHGRSVKRAVGERERSSKQ
jgi:hypothetical protein